MAEEQIKFKARAWARANTQSLDIDGTLFGCSHEFEHDRRKVSVRIPRIILNDQLRPVGRSEKIASLFSWQADGPRPETSRYHLWVMEITIDLPRQLRAPAALFDTPPKRPDLAGDALSEKFDKLAFEYQDRLAAAFEYWQQVARWITSSSELGCSQLMMLSHLDELEFSRLVRVDDDKAFWLPGSYAAVMPGTMISHDLWQAIGAALEKGLHPPLWFRYLDEAYRNATARDFTGAILSCAIACETLAREVLWLAGGATTSEDARELMGRVPVRSILGKWAKLTAIPKSVSRTAEIAQLFVLRNSLMHVGGRGQSLDDQITRKFFQAACTFVWTGDDWYFNKQGKSNPRPSKPLAKEGRSWPRTNREYRRSKYE